MFGLNEFNMLQLVLQIFNVLLLSGDDLNVFLNLVELINHLDF